jgi:hypothetical protein
MKRKAILGLLLLGSIAGFGFGALRLAHYRHHVAFGHGVGGRSFERRLAFERHVADLCVDAALRARAPAVTE